MAGLIHPWHRTLWQRALDLGERLPHAILIAGPAGQGKRDFAEALAARLLCEAPDAAGHACGQCVPCRWREAGNHPDLHRVVPGGDEGEGKGGEVNEATDEKATGKGKSAQILIDQIRALQGALVNTGHRGARRVVVVDPAEAMNGYTANALLKLLEEPPAGCVFLLVSHRPRQLLPTIRSRCQVWACPRPPADAVAAWLAGQGEECPPSLLALADGLPLAAQRLAARDGARLLARFVADLRGLPVGDPLRVAEQWDKWIKSKEALQAEFDLPVLIGWMQRWVADLATLRLGGRARFFPAEQAAMARMVAGVSVAHVTACYNQMLEIRRMASHPLNSRLVLEDMLLRYVRIFAGVPS